MREESPCSLGSDATPAAARLARGCFEQAEEELGELGRLRLGEAEPAVISRAVRLPERTDDPKHFRPGCLPPLQILERSLVQAQPRTALRHDDLESEIEVHEVDRTPRRVPRTEGIRLVAVADPHFEATWPTPPSRVRLEHLEAMHPVFEKVTEMWPPQALRQELEKSPPLHEIDRLGRTKLLLFAQESLLSASLYTSPYRMSNHNTKAHTIRCEPLFLFLLLL